MNLPHVEFRQYVVVLIIIVSLIITILRYDKYNFVLIRRYNGSQYKNLVCYTCLTKT